MSAVDYRRALHRIPELDNQLRRRFSWSSAFWPRCLPGVLSHHRQRLRLVRRREERCRGISGGAGRASGDGGHGPAPTPLSIPGGCMPAATMAHTAMVLTLAEYAAEHLAELPRNVLFLFQPSEETTGGAGKLCESGVLERYRVRRIFGLHLWPGLEAGTIASRPGPLMARSNEVTVTVEGRSVHMSRADEGLDALTAGISYLQRAYDMMEQLPPDQPRVLRFGKMVSGHSPERHQRPHRAGGEPAHLPGGHLPFLPSAAEGHRPVRGSGDRLQPGRPPQRGLPRRVEPRRALSEDRRPAGR